MISDAIPGAPRKRSMVDMTADKELIESFRERVGQKPKKDYSDALGKK